VEEVGIDGVPESPFIRRALPIVTEAFVDAFQLTLLIVGAIALLGAAVSLLLVRRTDWTPGVVFSRRSRWTWVAPLEGPALTRRPLPDAALDSVPPDPATPG
jgi:hypothetical protein